MKQFLVGLVLILLSFTNVLASNEPILLEAERAVLGADFAVGNAGTVQYVYPKTTNTNFYPGTVDKVLTFKVTFPEAGTYELYARQRVGAGGYIDDSFYNFYWFYFSNTAGGGQYFCKATSPSDPWVLGSETDTTDLVGLEAGGGRMGHVAVC